MRIGIRAILAQDVSRWDFALSHLRSWGDCWSAAFRFPVVKVPARRIDGAQAILGASSVAVPPSPTIGNLSQAHWWMLRAMSLQIVNPWLSRFRLA